MASSGNGFYKAASNGAHGRAHVAGLASAHPLGPYLPAMLQEDEFTQRWMAGLDGVLAPIFSTLDNFDAYLDPLLAPPDFLDWLGTWMGLVVDETWPVERRRAFVSRASSLYRMRGTPRGLSEHVRIFSGGEVEIVEHGGVATSTTTGAALPGTAGYDFIVRVTADDPSSIDARRLDALVAAAKPAHLTHKVEVVARSQPPARQGRKAPAAAVLTEEVVDAGPQSEMPPVQPSNGAEPASDGAEPPPQDDPPPVT